MYDFCEWTATDSVDMETLFGKWRLGKNITWLIVAIWKGRIEFSPLTEFAFNQEQSLRENILNSVATNVDPGEAMIWEKIQKTGTI